MRVFGQQSWIGGRQSVQTRSYFAAALPARWWLWGIDIQSDAYLDSAQIRYFRDVGTAIGAGDRLILCTAKPSWAEGHEPNAYRNLAYVEKNLVPDRCEAVLMISGDSHHYARYRSDTGREKITAGGGGAFLSATHALETECAGSDSTRRRALEARTAAVLPGCRNFAAAELAGAGVAVQEPVVHVGSGDPQRGAVHGQPVRTAELAERLA